MIGDERGHTPRSCSTSGLETIVKSPEPVLESPERLTIDTSSASLLDSYRCR